MKYVYAASAALFATPALAHPGHTHEVDGHTHTLTDLVMMGAVPAVIIGALAVFAVLKLRKRND